MNWSKASKRNGFLFGNIKCSPLGPLFIQNGASKVCFVVNSVTSIATILHKNSYFFLGCRMRCKKVKSGSEFQVDEQLAPLQLFVFQEQSESVMVGVHLHIIRWSLKFNFQENHCVWWSIDFKKKIACTRSNGVISWEWTSWSFTFCTGRRIIIGLRLQATLYKHGFVFDWKW